MKKSLLIVGALLVLTAGVASAQSGLNLSWNDCGTAGLSSKTFACDTNTGTNLMIGSAILGTSLGNAVGNESVFDLQANQAALSPWWTYGTSQCRLAAHFQAAFSHTTSCENPWVNSGFGAYNYTAGFNGPNRARFRAVWGMNPGTPMNGSTEYFIVGISLSNARSTGTGSCAGCTDDMYIFFSSSKVQEPAGGAAVTVSGPIKRDYVRWQPGGTPTRSSTWGSVKSLYR